MSVAQGILDKRMKHNKYNWDQILSNFLFYFFIRIKNFKVSFSFAELKMSFLSAHTGPGFPGNSCFCLANRKMCFNSTILGWHREYLKRFELALRWVCFSLKLKTSKQIACRLTQHLQFHIGTRLWKQICRVRTIHTSSRMNLWEELTHRVNWPAALLAGGTR